MIVQNQQLDHEYLAIEGLQSFTNSAIGFGLGNSHPAVLEKRV
jgi:aspartate/tyrosine/aromatic aminotransferase